MPNAVHKHNNLW